MRLSSVVHDCLYVNWAIPLPERVELPAGFTFDHLQVDGKPHYFASALLFRQRGLRAVAMPWFPVSHTQANLRLYVRDSEGQPAVLFRAIWVPPWLRPAMRWVAKVPAEAATLDFPHSPVLPDAKGTWRISCGNNFVVRTSLGCRLSSEHGNWHQTVSFFRQRGLGYIEPEEGLRQISAVQPDADAVPITADVTESDLADHALTGQLQGVPVYSAFLCERLPFEFELVAEREAEPLAPTG